MAKQKKHQKVDARHMIGVMNRGGSVRFLLALDTMRKTYDITALKPNEVTFTFMPPRCRQVKWIHEIFDSMDDLHQGISELAPGYKENKADHMHCWKGGKEHIHPLNSLGIKTGKCPTEPGTCGGSCRSRKG